MSAWTEYPQSHEPHDAEWTCPNCGEEGSPFGPCACTDFLFPPMPLDASDYEYETGRVATPEVMREMHNDPDEA